ncbi:MAG: hypothetical protein AAF790_15305 [Planctomycetota bacterium]
MAADIVYNEFITRATESRQPREMGDTTMGTQTQDFLHIGADGGRVVIYQRPDGGYFGVITGELIPAEFATEEERREQRRP